MIPENDIFRIVNGVAAQYAKGKFNGSYFDRDKFEDYRQELFLKAYTLLDEKPDMALDFFATCMWNRAGDIFNAATRTKEFVNTVEDFSIDEATPIPVVKGVLEHVTNSFESLYEEEQTEDLISKILDAIKSQSETLQTYVIAKLKLNGYLPDSYRPDIEIDKSQFDLQGKADNRKLLTDLFNMNNAPSGGTNLFKNEKRHLFLTLMSEFDVEDYYRKWYEVRYIDETGKECTECIKRFSPTEAENHIISTKNPQKVISVLLEE